MEIAIMVEGQMGLNWPRWMRIARAVEDLGFAALHRSDHFTNPNPPDEDSLELWVSLTWLASHTSRIEFGPLVTPVSFRHPAFIARMGAAVDDLSNGRLVLGVGAGWQEREHHNFSFDLLPLKERFARFEEGLLIITHLLQKDDPLTFSGKYYRMHDAVLLPRPLRSVGPPIVIGGNGSKFTLPLVARYAVEWNCVYQTAEKFTILNRQLDEELAMVNRRPEEVKRTMMTGIRIAIDEKTLATKLGGRNPEELRQRGAVVGTPPEVREQIEKLERVGLQRVMLQWLELDDLEGIELLAKTLIHG